MSPPVDKLVDIGGGNPACLHCQLGAALHHILHARGAPAMAGELLLAFAKMAGEVIAQSPAPLQTAYLRFALTKLAREAGYEGPVEITVEGEAVAPSNDAGGKVH